MLREKKYLRVGWRTQNEIKKDILRKKIMVEEPGTCQGIQHNSKV